MPLTLIAGSAGVYPRENDQSQQVVQINTTAAGIVAAFSQGPLGPFLCTSPTQFTANYGKSNLALGFGAISALAYLSQGNQLWVNRIVNTDARYATALTSALNESNVSSSFMFNSNQDYTISALYGTTGNYTSADQQVSTIYFSNVLTTPTGVSIVVTITNLATNTAYTTPTIVWSGSHLQTVTSLANAITTLFVSSGMNQAGYGQGYAVIANNTNVQIVSPENVLISASISLADSNGVTASIADTGIFQVWPLGPGSYGNNIGYSLTNLNDGVLEQLTLTFSGPIVTGNVINLSFLVNGVVVNIQPSSFGISSDNTMSNIATAIAFAAPLLTVSTVAASAGNVRQIVLIAPVNGPNTLSLNSYTISGGTSQTTMSAAVTVPGVAGPNTFSFNVYSNTNINVPLETFTVALTKQLDGFGNQLLITDVINTGNSQVNASQYIRVAMNPNITTDNNSAALQTLFPNGNIGQINWMGGGADGSIPTSAQISAGWNTFLDTESYSINMLINSGYTAISVQQTMANVATTRLDSTAILDFPSNQQSVNNALAYRQNSLVINTSYASVYAPDVQITDGDNDELIYAPPSGFVASRYVYTDNQFAFYESPAGVNRGALPTVSGLRYIYKKADRDVLDAVGINCIKQAKNGSGIIIFGDNTLQFTKSLLSAVNVRRALIAIETSIANSLESNLFDLDNPATQFIITQKINNYLQPIKDQGGIQDFLVLCNSSNNPGYFRDAGQLNVSVYIIPIRAIKVILLDTIITPATLSFNELIVQGIY